jgi:hypothetical protein
MDFTARIKTTAPRTASGSSQNVELHPLAARGFDKTILL